MFKTGYQFKNSNDEVLATVVKVIQRGLSHGFNDEANYFPPLYVCKKNSAKGMTTVTISESVLSGKERWTERDKVK